LIGHESNYESQVGQWLSAQSSGIRLRFLEWLTWGSGARTPFRTGQPVPWWPPGQLCWWCHLFLLL